MVRTGIATDTLFCFIEFAPSVLWMAVRSWLIVLTNVMAQVAWGPGLDAIFSLDILMAAFR